jgi:hypothetical protein
MTKQSASILFVCAGLVVGIGLCRLLHDERTASPTLKNQPVKTSMVILPKTSPVEAAWKNVFLSGLEKPATVARANVVPRVPIVPHVTNAFTIPSSEVPADPWKLYVILPTYPAKIIGQIDGRTGALKRLPETIMPSGDERQFLFVADK